MSAGSPRRVIQEKPKESRVSAYLSLSALSSSSICSRNPAKPAPSAGFTQNDPTPVGFSDSPASSVTAAPGSANNASRSAFAGFDRPRIVSSSPMRRRSGDRLAEVVGQIGQLLQPLLQRRVGRGQRRDAEAVGQRGGEEERVEGLGCAQVLGGDAGHVARPLLQCRGQR